MYTKRFRTISILSILVFLVVVSLPSPSPAEVVLDGTVGPQGSIAGPNYLITDSVGSLVGNNLFHSFQTFNINTGETGTFTGPSSIQNIIGRITGGTSSWVDGQLSCKIPGANLFLINPYGMMFGPNASLDVTGSFHASTADYLRLGETGLFHATHPEQSVLTVDPPSAFGFLDDTVAPITVNGSYLKVPEGETLSLVGGDITMTNGTLHAPGGRIDLVSVASAGEVIPGKSGPEVDSFAKLGNISITRSGEDHLKIDDMEIGDVDVSGEGGGVIYVRAGNFYVDRGYFVAHTFGNKDSKGGIDARVRKSVALDNGSWIASHSFGKGRSGDISIDAETLTISNLSDISSTVVSDGDGGNITVKTKTLVLNNGSDIHTWATNKSSGKAGDIKIEGGDSVLINSSSQIYSEAKGKKDSGTINIDTGYFSLDDGIIYTSSAYGGGNTGTITINASRFLLGANGLIHSVAWDQAKAGSITVMANDLTVEGEIASGSYYGSGDAGDILLKGDNLSFKDGGHVYSKTNELSGSGASIKVIASETLTIGGTDSSGGYASGLMSESYGGKPAGEIHVTASNFSLSEGGEIRSNSFGPGNGGKITVEAGELNVTRGIINSDSYGSGDGGAILLKGDNLSFRDGGQVNSISHEDSTGTGGNITVIATETLSIGGRDSSGEYVSGFSTDSYGEKGGGEIHVESPKFSLDEGGEMKSNSFGSGNGGKITVEADEYHAKGGDIFANSYGSGISGDILLKARSIVLEDGARVGSVAFSGKTDTKGGAITIEDAQSISIKGRDDRGWGSGLYSATFADSAAGDIVVSASNVFLGEGGSILATTDGKGDGGTITLNADVFHACGGGIASDTFGKGNAGNIVIDAPTISLSEGAQVDVGTWKDSEGNGGSITINSRGSVTISGEDSEGNPSGLFASTYGGGVGGDISVFAGSLFLSDGGTISAESTTTANAGSVNINTSNLLSIDSGLISTKASNAVGGDINISGKDIQLTHGGAIKTDVASGVGKGGNVNINASTLVLLEASSITAKADQGSGGDITIDAGAVFRSPDSAIKATSNKTGQDGKITVTSPVLDITSSLVPLRENLLNADELLPESCETRDPEEASSFIVESGEGVPLRPDELLR